MELGCGVKQTLLVPKPRQNEQMILLGSKRSERLILRELVSQGGLQPAGWGDPDGTEKG